MIFRILDRDGTGACLEKDGGDDVPFKFIQSFAHGEEGSDVGNKLILGPFRTTLLVVYEVSQEFGLDVGVYRGKIRIPDLDRRFRCMHNTT